MIDLSDYLWKLDKPFVRRATPGNRRRPATMAPGPELRWPCLAGRENRGTDAVLLRARLGSYQRALIRARRMLHRSNPMPAFNPVGASLFTTNSDGGAGSGSSAEQGGDL